MTSVICVRGMLFCRNKSAAPAQLILHSRFTSSILQMPPAKSQCRDCLGMVTPSLPAGSWGACMRRPRRRCCRRAHQPGRRSARSRRSAQRCRAHADRPAHVPAAGATPGGLAFGPRSAFKHTLTALPTPLQAVLTRTSSVPAADSACRTSVKMGLPVGMCGACCFRCAGTVTMPPWMGWIGRSELQAMRRGVRMPCSG